MRVCLVYDCLFPWTVGGQERYFRGLAEDLVCRGHEVTYLTRRQWPDHEPPDIPGVRVVVVSPDEPLYDDAGRRRIGEAVRFGVGTGLHLLRHRQSYDVVHLVGFPYFSVPAARASLNRSSTRIVVDWPEVWSRTYWRAYLGRFRGGLAVGVQRLSVRLTPEAFVFARLHGRRLRDEGMRGPITLLPGPVGSELAAHSSSAPERPLALFIGRLIPEKRALALPAAIAAARDRVPGLRGLIVGDGPELDAVRAEVHRLGLDEVIECPGFLPADELRAAYERATCLVAPSVREGYGLVVLEAAAAATPSLVVAGPDNAMVERITDGENGYVLANADPGTIAAGIVRVHEDGPALRQHTEAWFAAELAQLKATPTVAVVEPRYVARD